MLPCPFDEIAMMLWPHIEVWCTSCRAACRCLLARFTGGAG